MPRFFAVFLLLSETLLTLSAFGHQSYREVQRAKVLARLRAGSCDALVAQVLEPALHRTRGATRGAPSSLRGGSRSAAAIPDEVQRYSEYFSHFIAAEFHIAYGFDGDPLMYEAFRRDRTEGQAKIAVQKELGIAWPETGAPTAVPTWLEMATTIASGPKTFDAALLFYKKTGTATRNGKEEDVFDYRAIAPARNEAYPDANDGWQLMTKDTALNGVKFNIPFEVVFQMMQEGKFPMLDAIHDVSHFVAFRRFPEFAQSVQRQMAALTLALVKDAPGFKSREYWLTEALSLPDPDGEQSNHAVLTSYGRPTTYLRPIGEIEAELALAGNAHESRFLDYALGTARHLESQLRDVSGGNSSGGEKWFYLSEMFGMRTDALLSENVAAEEMSDHGRAEYGSPIQAALRLAETFFDGKPITLKANKKRLSNETATFTFNTLVTAQKILALSLQRNQLHGIAREEARKALRKFAARTEYLLANRPFTYREWATSFLQIDLPQADPLYRMLTTVFPNEIVSRYYLGLGEKRPVKTKPAPPPATRSVARALTRGDVERSVVLDELEYVEDGANDEE